MLITRRGLIGAGLGGAALAMMGCGSSVLLAQAPTDQRLVFLLLRGAMDGLHAVPSLGDPGYARARGELALSEGVHRLDSTFSLHPALGRFASLYSSREALVAHAVATPYRGRSHFDGQNLLEIGGDRPYEHDDGWLNRMIQLLDGQQAIAMSETIPLVLRGSAEVTSYAPTRRQVPDEDLLMRVSQLYQNDVRLHPMWQEALEAREIAGGFGDTEAGAGAGQQLAQLVSSFLTAPDGARIAMAESEGWDTHSGQTSRLNRKFAELDGFVSGLKTGLGALWSQTLVVIATEFGRTVAINGTRGTDHGTASAVLLAGGAIAGGRVISDWPGLAPAQLVEQRDLRPTMSLYGLLAGALGEHYGRDPGEVARAIFPGEDVGRPVEGIART